MQKRKLDELNLLDDFLFGTMVSYPGIGDAFVRILLKTILGKEPGKLIVVPQNLCQLLHYMEHTKGENAVNDSLRTLNDMVNAIKHNREVSLNYMKSFERDQMLIKQGIEQGRTLEEQKSIKSLIELCHELGISPEETAARVSAKYTISENLLKEYMDTIF